MGNLAIRVEQMVKTVIGRGDSTVLRLAKLARPLSVPLRQIFLPCYQSFMNNSRWVVEEQTRKERCYEKKHSENS